MGCGVGCGVWVWVCARGGMAAPEKKKSEGGGCFSPLPLFLFCSFYDQPGCTHAQEKRADGRRERPPPHARPPLAPTQAPLSACCRLHARAAPLRAPRERLASTQPRPLAWETGRAPHFCLFVLQPARRPPTMSVARGSKLLNYINYRECDEEGGGGAGPGWVVVEVEDGRQGKEKKNEASTPACASPLAPSLSAHTPRIPHTHTQACASP